MLRFVASTLVVCLGLAAQSNANKGSLGGFVSDSNGAAIPNASIRIIQESTGIARQMATNTAGMYEFSALDPGSYEIRVESAGFGAFINSISVPVGGTMRVNVGLALSSSTEATSLSSTAFSIAESVPTDILSQEVMRELPIDGRRFQDFSTLSPAVQALTETRGQLSFAGQRGIYSNVLLDGTDYNEPFLGGIRGGERSNFAFTIPQTAIQEFQAVRMVPPVEYGRTTGGILNVTTRSGSNTVHGEAFYQIRDGALGASDPLGRPPLERQQQFGGGAGGPIRKDKLFLFAAAERQLAAFPRQVRFAALDAFMAQVTPDIMPAYNYLRSLERPFDQTNDVTAAFGNVDYQFRRSDRLALRYNYSRNTANNAVAPGSSLQPQINHAVSANGRAREITHGGAAQWTGVFSASLVNDLRVRYGREDSALRPNSTEPAVDAGQLGSFGTAVTLPASFDDYRLQIADGLSLIHGRHSFSFGADYGLIGVRQNAGENQFGTYRITADPRRTLQILSGTVMNRFDDPSVVYLHQVGGLRFSGRVHQAAVYAQDNWRITPAFTVNLGVRWEAQFNPQPIADNEFLVANVRDFAFPRGRLDPTVIRNQLGQWSPRASFAWDVMGTQRSIVRGKAGLFYAQTPLAWIAGALNNVSMAPSDLSLQIAPNAAGTVYQQFAAAGFNLNQYGLGGLRQFTVPDVWMQVAGRPNPFAQANVITTAGGNFRNPRSAQLGLSVEHWLSNGVLVGYEVDHVSASHLERNVDWNAPLPFVRPGDQSLRPFFGLRSGVSRPNSNLGWVLVRDSSARANYTGHTFRIDYRRGPVRAGINYTLSYNKSDDDNERQLTGILYQNPYDFRREYNWSSIDARHQANGFITWTAPYGLTISSLFHFRSGLPIDASTGGDTSELLGGNRGNRPMERPGLTMLRNTFRNRSFHTVDFRVAKAILRKEALRIDVYGDVFNAFNLDNVAFISGTVFPNNPAFIYGPGVGLDGQLAAIDSRFMKLRVAGGGYDPATTVQQGSPLQAQVGLRLVF